MMCDSGWRPHFKWHVSHKDGLLRRRLVLRLQLGRRRLRLLQLLRLLLQRWLLWHVAVLRKQRSTSGRVILCGISLPRWHWRRWRRRRRRRRRRRARLKRQSCGWSTQRWRDTGNRPRRFGCRGCALASCICTPRCQWDFFLWPRWARNLWSPHRCARLVCWCYLSSCLCRGQICNVWWLYSLWWLVHVTFGLRACCRAERWNCSGDRGRGSSLCSCSSLWRLCFRSVLSRGLSLLWACRDHRWLRLAWGMSFRTRRLLRLT